MLKILIIMAIFDISVSFQGTGSHFQAIKG
jgi:hypothetical protein